MSPTDAVDFLLNMKRMGFDEIPRTMLVLLRQRIERALAATEATPPACQLCEGFGTYCAPCAAGLKNHKCKDTVCPCGATQPTGEAPHVHEWIPSEASGPWCRCGALMHDGARPKPMGEAEDDAAHLRGHGDFDDTLDCQRCEKMREERRDRLAARPKPTGEVVATDPECAACPHTQFFHEDDGTCTAYKWHGEPCGCQGFNTTRACTEPMEGPKRPKRDPESPQEMLEAAVLKSTMRREPTDAAKCGRCEGKGWVVDHDHDGGWSHCSSCGTPSTPEGTK